MLFRFKKLPIALYVPNLMGYARIVLAFIGLYQATTVHNPVRAVAIWTVAIALDFLDGIMARMLDQTSSLGVLIDIAADNILRTTVWMTVAISASSSPSLDNWHPGSYWIPVACFVVCLEWITMLSTQVHAACNQNHWKWSREQDPWIVRSYFGSNFRNPLGGLGIFGLFSASLFAYGSYHPILYMSIPYYPIFMYTSFVGRLLSMAIELWLCGSFFTFVVENDPVTIEKETGNQKIK